MFLECLEGRRRGGLGGVQEGKGVAWKSHGGSSESETTRISGPQRSSGTNTGGREGVNCTGWPGEKKSLAFDQSHEEIRNRPFLSLYCEIVQIHMSVYDNVIDKCGRYL